MPCLAPVLRRAPVGNNDGMKPIPVIRPARLEDANRLAALALQVWLHTYATEGVSEPVARYVLHELTPAKYTALLQNPSALVIVVERGENLLGFAVLQLDAPCPSVPDSRAELATLYVQEHFTRCGLGSRLLLEAQALAKERSGARLWLSVNAKNQRAIAFYRRHRYSQAGLAAFMLDGVAHDNCVMVEVAL